MMRTYAGVLVAGAVLTLGIGPVAAADPVKAEKTEQYLKVCSAFGAGYFYIPGTDTCLMLGGYLRSDTYVNAVGTFNPPISNVSGKGFNGPGAGVAGFPLVTADSSDYDTRTRALLAIETRTQTDYGVVRTLLRFGEQWDSQSQPGVSAGSSLYFERAFIQFAGFTAGYANSFFNAGSGITYIMATPYAGDNMWNTVLAYTAAFDGGLSASLSLEDATNRTTGVQAGAAVSAYTAGGALIPTATGMSYASYESGLQLPDLVGNVRLDQTWGTLMLSGALHRVGALSPPAAPFTSYVGENADSTLGWAVGAIAEFKLPMIAPGDSVYLQANYADGALNYLGLSGTPQVHATGLGSIQVGSTLLSSSGAYYPIADAVWNNNTLSYSTETGWAVSAQYKHYWMPTLRSGLYIGYVEVDVPTNTVGAFDVSVTQAVGNLVWTMARNLNIGVEVSYSRVAGEVPLANRAATTASGAATYATTGGSTDVWSGGMRVQRNF